MFLGIAALAAMLGTCIGFWNPNGSNYRIFLAGYLLLLSSLTVIAVGRDRFFHSGFGGSAVFGLLYLVSGLNCGFGVETMNEAKRFNTSILLGIAFIGVAFLTTETLVSLLLTKKQDAKESE